MGKSSHPGHFCAREILPGMLAQVLYYAECFLSVFSVLLELLWVTQFHMFTSGTVRTLSPTSVEILFCFILCPLLRSRKGQTGLPENLSARGTVINMDCKCL